MENINAIEDKNEEVSTTIQYIVVKIGNEQYGINIKYIDNIVRKQDITRVPKTQHYYKGVIKSRRLCCGQQRGDSGRKRGIRNVT